MYLQDRAQQWWQEEGSIIAKDGKWKPFSRALQKRFTPNMNQLFIPKYTRNLSQKHNEKSVDFMDRVRRELRDLGVDDEEQVVRGLHDWITEPLTMLVGDALQRCCWIIVHVLNYQNQYDMVPTLTRIRQGGSVHVQKAGARLI